MVVVFPLKGQRVLRPPSYGKVIQARIALPREFSASQKTYTQVNSIQSKHTYNTRVMHRGYLMQSKQLSIWLRFHWLRQTAGLISGECLASFKFVDVIIKKKNKNRGPQNSYP